MKGSEEEELPTIADFFSAAPWKHALFTTYALSLSYFESEILRPLLRSGCDDIKVRIQNYLWDEMTRLPESFDPDEIEVKTEAVFAHVMMAA
ncbi:MAG: hypothetical protein RLP02_06525 [Coleofasciculus sp. C2-GNP5-27]